MSARAVVVVVLVFGACGFTAGRIQNTWKRDHKLCLFYGAATRDDVWHDGHWLACAGGAR